MRKTHNKYDELEKNRKGVWEKVCTVLLTETEAETLNQDTKRIGVKYELVKKVTKKQ